MLDLHRENDIGLYIKVLEVLNTQHKCAGYQHACFAEFFGNIAQLWSKPNQDRATDSTTTMMFKELAYIDG